MLGKPRNAQRVLARRNLPGFGGDQVLLICQAIEFQGDMFRWSEIRQGAMRKDGANWSRDAPTRQLPSLLTVELGKKRRTGSDFSS